MIFAQFLGDQTEAVCGLANEVDPAVHLIADIETGEIRIGRKICPLRLHTITGHIYSELKNAENVHLVYRHGLELFHVRVTNVCFNRRNGLCFLYVYIHGTGYYIGYDSIRKCLCLQNDLDKSCLWRGTFISAIIAFHIDTATLISTKFILEHESGLKTPPAGAEQYSFECEEFFSSTGSRPSMSPGGVSLDFDKAVGCLFAVSIGDGVSQLAEPPCDTEVPSSCHRLSRRRVRLNIRQWLDVPEDRLYVIRGVEAAIYGLLRHVIWNQTNVTRLLPIISISASMDADNGCSFALLDHNLKIYDITSEIAKWNHINAVFIEGIEGVPTKQENILQSLSKRGLDEITDHVKILKGGEYSSFRLLAARWYMFLTEQLIAVFGPCCIVFSGSFFQVLWTHFIKSIFVQSKSNYLQCHLAKNPFRRGCIVGINQDIFEHPLIWKGSDLSINLGSAVACVRNISEQE